MAANTNKNQAPNTNASEENKEVVVPELNSEIIILLNELRSLGKFFDPNKTNKRQVRRSLATLEAVIVDLKEELNKWELLL